VGSGPGAHAGQQPQARVAKRGWLKEDGGGDAQGRGRGGRAGGRRNGGEWGVCGFGGGAVAPPP